MPGPIRRLVSGRRASRELQGLSDAASRAAGGNLAARVPEDSRDAEIARLQRAFNEMMEAFEQRRVETMEETRAREAFFAQVSHEFRTPLTSIVGYGDMLLADARGLERIDLEERTEALETTERNARRLLRLVNDLLFAARVGADKLRIQHADFDIATIARQAVDAAEPAAASAGVTLKTDAPRSLPARGDAGRMTQALDNLLSNAIKFLDEGGQAGVRVLKVDRAAQIAVWDTGPGIPAEALPHLFERFYRGPGLVDSPGHGAGLGLPIARAIVEAHGGRLEVSSTEGEGSTFTMTIPLARP